MNTPQANSIEVRTIDGFADVFNTRPGHRQEFPGPSRNPQSDLLFELHTTCTIRANDRLSLCRPEIFHINWMDLQRLPGNGSLPTSIHRGWERQHLQES
jgi:hypothetical protein